jgi:hypothetical protein
LLSASQVVFFEILSFLSLTARLGAIPYYCFQ